MLNFDSLSLKALVTELEPVLTSGRVQKVQQPSRNEILLTIRAIGQTQKIYISIDPKYPHIAPIGKEGEALRDFEMPQAPPMFCMLLRKHLEGAKIKAVTQPGYERILELHFDSYNELGAKVPMVLACEIMGKHSNIILYNYDTNVILGCAHNISSEKSRERELAGGLPYIYPPKQDKVDLKDISSEQFIDMAKIITMSFPDWLNQKFGYVSKALANELCKVCGIDVSGDKILAVSKDKLFCLYEFMLKTLELENFNPAISSDNKFYSIISLDSSKNWVGVDSAGTMLDKYFGYQIFEDKFNRLKLSLNSIIKKELKKLKTQIVIYEKNINAEEKRETYKVFADLIMANLYRIEKGHSSIILENIFSNNEPIEIKLEETLSANENAQKYYKLYNKSKSAALHSEELTKKINKEIFYLETVKESINLAESIDDLKQIKQELSDYGLVKKTKINIKSKKEKKEKIQLLKFVSSDNFEICLGKNNRQNDYLLKNAFPDDIWLHTQNMPGSHVLIKTTQENKEVPESTLHEAVYLAAYYSSGRESSNVPVVYTKSKFVKKPSGSKPGFVIYTHEKTLYVNPEKEKTLKPVI